MDENQKIVCSLEMEWKPTGKVEFSEDDGLSLPSVDTIPAIYRFSILQDGEVSQYIGQTKNVRTRFSQYRNPHCSQATNVRINRALETALKSGAEVYASLIIEAKGNKDEELDLSLEVVRCYLENAAILCGDASDIKNLNQSTTND